MVGGVAVAAQGRWVERVANGGVTSDDAFSGTTVLSTVILSSFLISPFLVVALYIAPTTRFN